MAAESPYYSFFNFYIKTDLVLVQRHIPSTAACLQLASSTTAGPIDRLDPGLVV